MAAPGVYTGSDKQHGSELWTFCANEKKEHKRKALTAGLIFNIGALAVFKYVGTGGFLPLGISFFTFTQIAFLMESCRGNLKEVGALSYGLYVSFFPKMIQGPIALPGEVSPQEQKLHHFLLLFHLQ